MLRQVLQKKKLKLNIYVTSKSIMDSIIGYSLNKRLAAAAIVNVKKIPFDPSVMSHICGPLLILDDVSGSKVFKRRIFCVALVFWIFFLFFCIWFLFFLSIVNF
jgi:hypothetical protein